MGQQLAKKDSKRVVPTGSGENAKERSFVKTMSAAIEGLALWIVLRMPAKRPPQNVQADLQKLPVGSKFVKKTQQVVECGQKKKAVKCRRFVRTANAVPTTAPLLRVK